MSLNLVSLSSELGNLFSSSGVSSNFFSMFSFLDFLDNSTDKWKSRLAKLRNYQPNERLAWYINEYTNSKKNGDLLQWSVLFGHLAESGEDDRTKVDYKLAKKYNELLFEASDGKGTILHDGMFPKLVSEWTIDLTKTVGYNNNLLSDSNLNLSSIASTNIGTTFKYMAIALGGYFLLKKFKII